MNSYIPLAQNFAARVVLFHSAVAAKLGLNATDLKTLRLLGEESMTAGSLAEHTGLTGAAVTALLDRLEAGGFVVRERGAHDRRRVTVHAVPEKIREIDRLYDGLYARMSKLLSQYNAAEFTVITEFLEQTAQTLGDETTKLRDQPSKPRRPRNAGAKAESNRNPDGRLR